MYVLISSILHSFNPSILFINPSMFKYISPAQRNKFKVFHSRLLADLLHVKIATCVNKC